MTKEGPSSREKNSYLQDLILKTTVALSLVTSFSGAPAFAETTSRHGRRGPTEVEGYINKDYLERRIVSETKIDIGRAAHESGFVAEMTIPNGEGPYILKIGQIHANPFVESDDPNLKKKARDMFEGTDSEYQSHLEKQNAEVRRIQKGIEDLVLRLSKLLPHGKGRLAVFLEGFTPEVIEGLHMVVDTTNTLHKLYREGTDEEKNSIPEATKNLISQMIKQYDQSVRVTDRITIGYAIKKVMDGFPIEFQSRLRDELGTEIGKEKLQSIESEGEDIYFDGAGIKLALDGKINMGGAEPKDAIKALEKRIVLEDMLEQFGFDEELKKKVRIAAVSGITPDLTGITLDADKKALLLEAASELFRVALTEREDLAVSTMAEAMNALKHPYIAYIIGADHRLEDNVRRFNMANPDRKMGLIAFSDILTY